MADRGHPVDVALRQLAGSPEPRVHAREMAHRRLAAAISTDGIATEARPRGQTVWKIAVVVVLLGVVAISQLLGSSPTSANMEAIASALESVDPVEVPPQSYLYTRTDSIGIGVEPRDGLGGVPYSRDYLVYLSPIEREDWVGSEGATQIRFVRQTPIFFREEDEEVYTAAGFFERHAIGEAVVEAYPAPEIVETWPDDLEDLDAEIRSQAQQGPGVPPDVQYLDVAMDILREASTSPRLRANTLRLIGDLPDLIVVETSSEETTFAIEYPDEGIATRRTFTLDARGNLLSDEVLYLEADPRYGIPANTPRYSAEYTPPVLVDSLDGPDSGPDLAEP